MISMALTSVLALSGVGVPATGGTVSVAVASRVNLDAATSLEHATELAAALVDVSPRLGGAEAPKLVPDGCLIEAECADEARATVGTDLLVVVALHRLGGEIRAEASAAREGLPLTRLARFTLDADDPTGPATRQAAIVIATALGLDTPAELPTVAATAPPTAETELARAPESGGGDTAKLVGGIGLGVSAGLLAGGIGFGLAALDSDDALDADGCATRACDPSRVDDLEAQQLAADLFFAGAAVVAVASTIALVLGASADDTSPEVAEGLIIGPSSVEVRF